MKSNFNKDKTRNDGLYQQCLSCRKQNYLENRDRIKDYYLDNRDRIKEYQLKNHDKLIARKKIFF